MNFSLLMDRVAADANLYSIDESYLSTNQHLKQQGTIILPVFNLNLEPNPPKFQSLKRSYPPDF
ncbi:hypothetical protein BV372_10545 [Nostoc sp. T09]|nr:hypothetical protein BV372_10545 [Nostoc sp. T09]